MGCNCGSATGKQTPAQRNKPPQMRSWFESQGWRYVGGCGCSSAKDVFVNDSIPGWQVWISPNNQRMSVMQMFGPDHKERGIAGPQNYQQVYGYWMSNRDKLKIKTNEE